MKCSELTSDASIDDAMTNHGKVFPPRKYPALRFLTPKRDDNPKPHRQEHVSDEDDQIPRVELDLAGHQILSRVGLPSMPRSRPSGFPFAARAAAAHRACP